MNEPPFGSRHHIAIQCSSIEFDQCIDDNDRILFSKHSLPSLDHVPVSPLAGYVDCGIQVDIGEHTFESLSQLIESYSNRLSIETIKQFYEICQNDLSSTRTQLDAFLVHAHVPTSVSTLRQLSFNVLQQWDQEIKYSNPSFGSVSIGDLLRDINDEHVLDDFMADSQPTEQTIEFAGETQILMPWPLVDKLQTVYGELHGIDSCSSNTNGMLISLDDDLSFNVYQALQRFVGVSDVCPMAKKPVMNKTITTEKKNKNKNKNKTTSNQQQEWKLPSSNVSTRKSNRDHQGPSLKQIMDEELNYINTHKPVQVRS
jgi:hypothetical protein